MSEILFQVTTNDLESGLRGIPVGYCTTSHVDPLKGLFYRGIPIVELKDAEPEEVIHLLYHGKTDKPVDTEKFSHILKQRARCSHAVIQAIKGLPTQGHPMKLLSIALLILGMLESKGDYREDCLNLIAKVPHLVAILINHHGGFGDTPLPRDDLSYMGNFTHMLQIPDRDKKLLEGVFKLFNILHYDHGGGNLSTFVGKSVASGLSDLYASVSAAMDALSGPRHGKANQDCLDFTQQLLDELGEKATAHEVEHALRQKLEKGDLVYGFGHAVLRAEDSRATVLYDYANKHFASHPLVKMASLLRTMGSKVLAENPKIADPHPNVDAISGVILSAAGFPYSEYYTVLFGLSRMVGIAIQIVYERCDARGGKGTPIVRPKYIYKPSCII